MCNHFRDHEAIFDYIRKALPWEKISPDDRYMVFVFGFLMIVVIVGGIWR
jgi:hypothetical protein